MKETKKDKYFNARYKNIFKNNEWNNLLNNYSNDVEATYNGTRLNLQELKKGLGNLACYYKVITTEIEDVMTVQDCTVVRMKRDVIRTSDEESELVNIIVINHMKSEKIYRFSAVCDSIIYSNVFLSISDNETN
jgi:hypothetical protein